jgi:hypothetical protein
MPIFDNAEKKIIIDNEHFELNEKISFEEFRAVCDIIETSENMVESEDDTLAIWEATIDGMRIRDTLDMESGLTILELI